jgi:hypothetical protein
MKMALGSEPTEVGVTDERILHSHVLSFSEEISAKPY